MQFQRAQQIDTASWTKILIHRRSFVFRGLFQSVIPKRPPHLRLWNSPRTMRARSSSKLAVKPCAAECVPGTKANLRDNKVSRRAKHPQLSGAGHSVLLVLAVHLRVGHLEEVTTSISPVTRKTISPVARRDHEERSVKTGLDLQTP